MVGSAVVLFIVAGCFALLSQKVRGGAAKAGAVLTFAFAAAGVVVLVMGGN